MNRRQFGAALAAAATAGGSARATALAGGIADAGGWPLHVVYDRRLTSRPAALTAGAGRVAGWHAFAGDVTPVWHDALRPLWHRRAIATMGITRHAEFFVLSTLAREAGYVVARADEHARQVNWLLVPGPTHARHAVADAGPARLAGDAP